MNPVLMRLMAIRRTYKCGACRDTGKIQRLVQRGSKQVMAELPCPYCPKVDKPA